MAELTISAADIASALDVNIGRVSEVLNKKGAIH